MFLIFVEWKQSNAQDATVKKLLKSSGLIDRGNLGAIDKKPEVEEVVDHVWQLLMNNLFLENYFMIFGRHKDRVILEIPVDDKPKQTS